VCTALEVLQSTTNRTKPVVATWGITLLDFVTRGVEKRKGLRPRDGDINPVEKGPGDASWGGQSEPIRFLERTGYGVLLESRRGQSSVGRKGGSGGGDARAEPLKKAVHRLRQLSSPSENLVFCHLVGNHEEGGSSNVGHPRPLKSE